jgi:macrocin-O-methyltransferase TylF-like protien
MSKALKLLGHHSKKYAPAEQGVMDDFCAAFTDSRVPLSQRLQTFPRHVRRQDIARFLVKHELFRLSLPANGSIVECGVFAGGGLLGWLHFSAIYEPYNHTRRIIGFDTFSGFPGVHQKDLAHGASEHTHKGAFQTHDGMVEELAKIVAIHDRNRPLGHIPKVELVAGDACKTVPRYVKEHPHLLISLLYLDFDIYAPTKVALEKLFPRIVKGGVIAFDELNCPEFAGETTALLESFDLRQVELKRFPFDPYISYFIK